jgi:hypothetical protein
VGPRAIWAFPKYHLSKNFKEFYKIEYGSKKIIKNMKINQHKILYPNKISKRIFEDNYE